MTSNQIKMLIDISNNQPTSPNLEDRTELIAKGLILTLGGTKPLKWECTLKGQRLVDAIRVLIRKRV